MVNFNIKIPGEKLLIKIWDSIVDRGIGGLLHPRQIKRLGKARAEVRRDDLLMMAQTENPFIDEYNIGQIYDNIRKAFPIVESLAAPMIIYPGVFWTFAFASKKHHGNDITPEKIKELITDKTKAIMPIHIFGLPADMKTICDVANDHNLKIIKYIKTGIKKCP